MATVIARTEIHRTVEPGKAKTLTAAAVKPVVKIIKPGTRFVAEGKELDELLSNRAVSKVAEEARPIVHEEEEKNDPDGEPSQSSKPGKNGRKGKVVKAGKDDDDAADLV